MSAPPSPTVHVCRASDRAMIAVALITAAPAFARAPPTPTQRAPDTMETRMLACAPCPRKQGEGIDNDNFPRLAGKPAGNLKNQLVAFRDGRRRYPPMNDLLEYHTDEPLPRIVESGAPLRGIAPCGVSHGDIGGKAGAAWLEGQPVVHLRAQLQAFASGARRNDIGEQMRNVARRTMPDEIAAASKYYAERS